MGVLGSQGVELRYRDRAVLADDTECPWKIRGVDDAEIDWRVLLYVAELEDHPPIVLANQQDVDFLEEEAEIPSSLKSDLRDSLPSEEEESSPANREPDTAEEEERRQEENARINGDLIERYLSLGEREPSLRDDPSAWFDRACKECLFGSLTLYDTARNNDPCPVGNGVPNWDLQRNKGAAWVARAFTQAGQSTLYEISNYYRYTGAAQGRRLVLSGTYTTLTDFSGYIPGRLTLPGGTAAPPQNTPFVIRAAETSG
jgi:hypothetical protein